MGIIQKSILSSDWSLSPLSKLCDMKSGEGITGKYITSDGPYPCYGGNGLRGFTTRYTHKGQYPLIGRQGALCGNVVFASGEFFASEHAVVATPKGQVNSKWLAYVLERMNLNQYSESSAQPGLSVSKLLNLEVRHPNSYKEQEAIANALSDADAYTKSLERLIAKKRLIKKGVMQELLTGKKRLDRFKDKWQKKLLGELVEKCTAGATPYRGKPEYYGGKINWITSGELNYNVIFETDEHITEQALIDTNLMIHKPGTFLMAITGLEAEGTRGSCGIVGVPSATNQSCMAIYPNNLLSTKFLYHFYVFKGKELAQIYCQGTKQQSYTAGLVKLLPIDIPSSVEEQNSISSVLDSFDTEIYQLEKKLQKARLIKQGMVHELLTGRIRLV